MTKIAHLTSVHSPFDVRIFHKECRTLASAGYEVILIVPAAEHRITDGVRLRIVPTPSGRRERLIRTVRQVYQAAVAEDADIYHLHDPELLLPGLLLALRGKPVVYDAHEDLPKQTLRKHWIPKPMRMPVAAGAGALEALVVRRFAGVVAATPSIARRFPASKTVVVQNYPILNELYREDEANTYEDRPNRILYVGGITRTRGVHEIVHAVSKVRPAFQARLVLAGDFVPSRLAEDVSRLEAWGHVDFLGWVSRRRLKEVLKAAKVGLVLFHPAPNHLEAQPTKLFEFMSAGLPVIASDFPLWRDIVEHAHCGILVDPLDVGAIADAVQWLLEHPGEAEGMGKRGQEAVRERYHWQRESRKLLSLYEQLV